jgi:hypothetical protein
MNETTRSRWTRRVAGFTAALATAGGLVGVSLAAAAPATAAVPVSGLVKVTGSSVTNSSGLVKTATAFCPPDKVILGGGGRTVEADGAHGHRLRLFQLQPSDAFAFPGGGFRPGYRASAHATELGVDAWRVEAYALCAFPVAGRHIVPQSIAQGFSPPVLATAAVCPPGERVLGSGARVDGGAREVGLQVARPSGPGDIARAQGHEDANGYGNDWDLVAFAVCAPPPSGYEVIFGESQQRLSESVKTAFAGCTGTKRVIGAGAAITNVAPGHVALEEVNPYFANQVRATAVEHVPYPLNWDFIVATAICATAV